jgi:beta-carotene 3-hydroxylase
LILEYGVETLLVFIAMEGVSWFLHQYVMHGLGWSLHKSHHEPKSRIKSIFEKNDLYVIPFMVLNILGFYYFVAHDPRFLPLPIGSTLYGSFYFLFHEVIVHRRIPNKISSRASHPYLIRLIRAHHIHHSSHTKDGAESFSFLYADPKYGFQSFEARSKSLS